ncbi:MAG: DUF1573 domain-containing protein [Candidatus Aminicenantes bacterium]|nr:DUF1573 domain-containing protein [Candidatus Aminicenantes bacterium]
MNISQKKRRAAWGAVLAATAVLVASAAQPGGKPKIAFDRETWDFGRVKQGDNLEFEFLFRNEGRSVLVIDKVETTCGCTAALVSENKVEPGKQGRIKVAFATAGYGGRVTKHIFVRSNDPDRRRVQLAVTADIDTPPQPKFDIAPFNVELGLLLEGEPLEADLVLRNRGERELVVECEHKGAAFFSDGRALSFPLRIAPGKEQKTTLRLKPSGRSGVLREYVLFRSNDPSRQALSFGLSGYVATAGQVREFLERNKNRLK